MSRMSELDLISRLENSPDNQETDETEVRKKIHEYFFSILFSDKPPMQIDFGQIGEYFQNIQIKDALVLDEKDDIFSKYGISGYLLRATINKQNYILFTESLDLTNSVWHANETEIRYLCVTNQEDSLHANTLELKG